MAGRLDSNSQVVARDILHDPAIQTQNISCYHRIKRHAW